MSTIVGRVGHVGNLVLRRGYCDVGGGWWTVIVLSFLLRVCFELSTFFDYWFFVQVRSQAAFLFVQMVAPV